MYLKSLEVNNFQCHKHLKIDFVNNVNVIYGQTASGKSCLRRALEWVYYNESKGYTLRKIGTKKTSAKITLDNDIQVERIKSASVNAYILYINGEEKRFDAIGKEIPEEVRKVLKSTHINVDNEKLILNIDKQMTMQFLLGRSDTFKSKLFNQLTGSDIVDKASQSFNKDILHIGKEEKIEKEHLEEQKKSLEELDKKKVSVKKVYNLLTTSYNELEEKLLTYEKIKDYSQQLNDINIKLKETNDKLKTIKIINQDDLEIIETCIENLDYFNKLYTDLQNINENTEIIQNKLKDIKIPEINIKELQEKIEQLNKLQKIVTQLNNTKTNVDKLITKNDNLTKEIKENIIEYKTMLKKIGKCPTCHSKISEEILKEIKL